MSNGLKIVHLKPHEITVIEGRNPRITLLNIEQLAESIAANGIRNPIKVQPTDDGYELVDGHRRLAACQYLIDTAETEVDIPAIVVEHYNDEADVLVEMMVSNDGEPFAPFEEAMLYARLRDDFEMSNDQIAARVGKSISHVSDKLALLRADETIKRAVQEKIITTSDANTIIRKSKGDTEKQKKLVERIETEGREAVIEKDLKKGRMAKPLWSMAENAYDMAWSAFMEIGVEHVPTIIDAESVIDALGTLKTESDAKTILCCGIGQLMVFSNVSGLSLRELWDKLETRLNGSPKQ